MNVVTDLLRWGTTDPDQESNIGSNLPGAFIPLSSGNMDVIQSNAELQNPWADDEAEMKRVDNDLLKATREEGFGETRDEPMGDVARGDEEIGDNPMEGEATGDNAMGNKAAEGDEEMGDEYDERATTTRGSKRRPGAVEISPRKRLAVHYPIDPSVPLKLKMRYQRDKIMEQNEKLKAQQMAMEALETNLCAMRAEQVIKEREIEARKAAMDALQANLEGMKAEWVTKDQTTETRLQEIAGLLNKYVASSADLQRRLDESEKQTKSREEEHERRYASLQVAKEKEFAALLQQDRRAGFRQDIGSDFQFNFRTPTANPNAANSNTAAGLTASTPNGTSSTSNANRNATTTDPNAMCVDSNPTSANPRVSGRTSNTSNGTTSNVNPNLITTTISNTTTIDSNAMPSAFNPTAANPNSRGRTSNISNTTTSTSDVNPNSTTTTTSNAMPSASNPAAANPGASGRTSNAMTSTSNMNPSATTATTSNMTTTDSNAIPSAFNPTTENPNTRGTISNPGPSNEEQPPAGPLATPPNRRVTWARIKARQAKENARNRHVFQSQVVDEPDVLMQDDEWRNEENEGDRPGVRFRAADFRAVMEEVFADVMKKRGFSDIFDNDDNDDEGHSPWARKRTGRVSKELRAEKVKDKKWERKAFCDLVRSEFRAAFGVKQQEDFTLHDPPEEAEVRRYELEIEGGPEASNLKIAMRSSLKSEWNRQVANIVLDAIHKARTERTAWDALPQRSDDYYLDIIFDQMERAKTAWGAAQHRMKENGEAETPREVENRMLVNKMLEESRARVYTRRYTKYNRRISTLTKMVEERREDDVGGLDLETAEWLLKMVEFMGKDGMSSEESEEDPTTHLTTLHVKEMPHRRPITRELNFIDKQRVVDKTKYSKRGTQPQTRIRSPRAGDSRRKPFTGRPMTCYDPSWLDSKSDSQVRALDISSKEFQWRDILL